MIEAELKAPVDHPDRIRSALAALAEPKYALDSGTYTDAVRAARRKG